MEAELRSNLARTRAPINQGMRVRDDWRHVVFSVAQARRALPYVSAVARDAAAAFKAARQCVTLLDDALSERTRGMLCQQRDRAIARLGMAIDECNLAGVHLFDLETGSVSLHGEVEGRPATLIWRGNDPVQPAWTDLPDE